MNAPSHTINLPISGADIKELSMLQTWKSILTVFGELLIIASCIFIHKLYPNIIMYLLVWFIISTRLYAMYSLLHDAIHYSISRNKTLNDFIGQVFLGFPLFISLAEWRKNHTLHHKHLQTEDDPEIVHLSYTEFSFPKKKQEIFKILVCDITGINFLYYKCKKIFSGIKKPKELNFITVRSFFFILIVTIFLFYLNIADDVLIYWIIPYITLFQLLTRIRLSTEHLYVDDKNPFKTRTVTPSIVEKIIFSPHNIGYHTEHHLYPTVPFYNLPKLHTLLISNKIYSDNTHIYLSYRELLNAIILK